jgi:hypothetical protein
MSRHKTQHQKFVETTERILTETLAFAETFPIGSWISGYTRPDIFIVQRSAIGKQRPKGRECWIGSYDRYFIVECKVGLQDIPNAIFQLLMALLSIRSLQDLDFHHGGLGPVLAMPTRLRHLAEKGGLLKELQDVFGELNFGLVVVDSGRRSVEWLLRPSSF